MNRLHPEAYRSAVPSLFRKRTTAILLAMSLGTSAACSTEVDNSKIRLVNPETTTEITSTTENKVDSIDETLSNIGDDLAQRVVRIKSVSNDCTGVFVGAGEGDDVLISASHCDTNQQTGFKTSTLRYLNDEGKGEMILTKSWVSSPQDQDILVAKFPGQRSADKIWQMPDQPEDFAPQKDDQFIAVSWPTRYPKPIVAQMTFLGLVNSVTVEPKFVFYVNPDDPRPNTDQVCTKSSSGSPITNGKHTVVMSAAWQATTPSGKPNADWPTAVSSVESRLGVEIPDDVTQICYGAEINTNEVQAFSKFIDI